MTRQDSHFDFRIPENTRQIYDEIEVCADLHGVTLQKEDLIPGVLISGASGSGKTVTAVNSLALNLALQNKDDADKKAAIIYFVAKGEPHADFIRSLPAERRKDVVVVGNGETDARLQLFPYHFWDKKDAADASVEFLLEYQRHAASTADDSGNHKAYWDSVSRNVLTTLAHLRRSKYADLETVEQYFCGDAVEQLANRALLFCEHLTHISRNPATAKPTVTAADVATLYQKLEIPDRADMEQWLHKTLKNCEESNTFQPDKLKVIAFLAEMMTLKDEDSLNFSAEKSPAPITPLLKALSNESTKKLAELVQTYSTITENTLFSVIASIEGLAKPFAKTDLKRLISIEEVIDEGKILVVNYPIAGSAGGLRSLSIAAQLAFFLVSTSRAKIKRNGKPINRVRPVVAVIDEFHLSISRGRNEGLAKFMSICRESGVSCILAAQNLHLVASALGGREELDSLTSNVNTHLYFYNPDNFTNSWATKACGQNLVRDKSQTLNFSGDEELDELFEGEMRLAGNIASEKDFLMLARGQFLARLGSGDVYAVDARHQLSSAKCALLGSRYSG